VLVSVVSIGPVEADAFLIDLTHPLGTFNPTEGDLTKPDLTKPHADSIAVPTFGNQAVYEVLPNFPTNQGHFVLGRILLYEHHGTHMDSPGHFVNDVSTKEAGNPPQKLMHELAAEELIGKAVVIDIGSRVQAELDKNGGKPSPDKAVTDFSDASVNVITPEDIDAVAPKLNDGVWIVANLGWSRFFYDANWETTPYFNGWNFPGFNRGAIDRLIEVEDQKGIRINGIVIDNIGVDTGESSKGTDDKWSDSFRSHVRGLQRGWKFVENATNLDQVAMAKADSCTIVVGAPKHVGGGGGPSRVFALCDK
jgi:kynurenine formamidase